MQTLWQDIHYGIRRLWKSPGFTVIALLSLALGIGANTAIFSLVNTVLFTPLEVANPERLVSVSLVGPNDSMQTFSYPSFLDFRERNEVLSAMYATRFAPMSLSRDGQNERVWGYLVSGNYFESLGVGAALGRVFTQEEDRVELQSPLAVISHKCWQTRFGSDPQVIGKSVIINNHSYEIIGVAPAGFDGTDLIYVPEIWVPMTMQSWIEPGSDWLTERNTHNIFVTGYVKPGVSREQAEASLNLLADQLGKEYPASDEGLRVKLIPPGFILPNVRDGFAGFAAVLMATVALVLLIACTNLANLLLARATERRKEIAIRLSIGASRWRLIRQLLTESLILSALGGAVGILLGVWIINLFLAFKPPIEIPLTLVLKTDWRVLLFSIAVSILTSLIFGLVPAWQATKPELVPALKDTTSQSGYRRSWLRSGLVVGQITLSLVLLIAAGLVIRALQRVETINPGFEVKNGLLLSFDVGLQGYDEAKGKQFQRQVIERVQSLPGVRSASLTTLFPLSLNYSSNNILIEGQPPLKGANAPMAMVSSVGLNYFSTMSIPLFAGRDFTEHDSDESARVVVVNEAFVKKFFPGQSPEEALNKRFRFIETGNLWQIVGVAKDGKYWTIGEDPQPFVYRSLLRSYETYNTMIVRTEGSPQAMIGAIRGEVQKLDATLPLYDIKTIEEHMGVSLFPARVAATLLGSFGLLALLLATIGIYGVTAYSVAQRTRELGIRMALGASPLLVFQLVLKQGLRFALIGLGIGLTVAFAVTRLMESLLYGVSATDVLTFAGVSILLTLVVLFACFVPARRAMKVDPMVALRYE